jgi:hypothetical protein
VAKRGFENSEEGYMVEKGCSLTLRPDELARPCVMYQKITANDDNSYASEDVLYLRKD